MRTASTALSCLLGMAMLPFASAVPSVEVVVPQKACQRIRVTTQVSGRPRKDVKVDVYRYNSGSGDEPKLVLSFNSDDGGVLVTPMLSLGHYHLIASSGPKLRADLYLDVSKKSGKNESSFSMELSESSYPTLEEQWAAADKMFVKDRVRAFHGIIYDLSGAPIRGVSIEVAKKGSVGHTPVFRAKSGPNGEFSAQLSEGTYVALFSMPGFHIVFLSLEVIGSGSKSLRVTLPLADMTEAATVSRDQQPQKRLADTQ